MTEINYGPPSPTVLAAAKAIHAVEYPDQDWMTDNSPEERNAYIRAAVVALAAKPSSGPIERKVTWAALGALGASLAVAGLEWAQGGGLATIAGVPGWAGVVLTIAAPPLLAWLAGYQAPHTERPDLAGGQ